MPPKSPTRSTKRSPATGRPSSVSRGRIAQIEPAADALSEEAIVDAATAIIKEVGVKGLTMRRLSDDLGVALGATYHHVANRNALLSLVAARVQEQVALPDESGDWLSKIKELLLNHVSVVGQYEGLAAFIMSNQDTAPHTMDVAMHRYLDEAGFSKPGAETVMSALFFYIAGTMVSGLMTTRVKGVSQRAMRARFNDGLDVLLKGVAIELKEDRKRSR